MPQEHINLLLALFTVSIPFVQFLLNKFFGRKMDSAQYSDHLFKLATEATEQLRKARDEINSMEEQYDKTIELIRIEHNTRIDRLKNRVAELETITRVYKVTFDLVTHPNVEIKNPNVEAMDDVSASQKTAKLSNTDQPPK